jgi:murein DD-endopeptidase MepM/ murein hydrolase activator NlpD
MRLVVVSLVVVLAAPCGCAAAARTSRRSTPHEQAQEIAGESSAVADVAPAAAPHEDAAEPADGIVHVVQPGQTLWRIARAYDVPLDTLVEANGVVDPSRVEVGTPIFVPGARATLLVAPYPAPPPSSRSNPAIRPELPADFLWPVAGGEFMRPFGEARRNHAHAGVDIRGAKGQDILSARDGVVAFCGPTSTGYGTMVVVDHGDGVQTLYAHAEKVLVEKGDTVRRGQPIAHLGRTGNATTEHCHFELRLENRAVDPMPYLLGTTEAHR